MRLAMIGLCTQILVAAIICYSASALGAEAEIGDKNYLTGCDSASSTCLLSKLREIQLMTVKLKALNKPPDYPVHGRQLSELIHSEMFSQVKDSQNRYRACGAIDVLSCLKSYRTIFTTTKKNESEGKEDDLACLGLSGIDGRESITFLFVKEDEQYKLASYHFLFNVKDMDKASVLEEYCWSK